MGRLYKQHRLPPPALSGSGDNGRIHSQWQYLANMQQESLSARFIRAPAKSKDIMEFICSDRESQVKNLKCEP